MLAIAGAESEHPPHPTALASSASALKVLLLQERSDQRGHKQTQVFGEPHDPWFAGSLPAMGQVQGAPSWLPFRDLDPHLARWGQWALVAGHTAAEHPKLFAMASGSPCGRPHSPCSASESSFRQCIRFLQNVVVIIVHSLGCPFRWLQSTKGSWTLLEICDKCTATVYHFKTFKILSVNGRGMCSVWISGVVWRLTDNEWSVPTWRNGRDLPSCPKPLGLSFLEISAWAMLHLLKCNKCSCCTVVASGLRKAQHTCT